MEHLDGGASQWRAGGVNESCRANARALHLSCIDPATQDLRPEIACAKRKAWLNGNTVSRLI